MRKLDLYDNLPPSTAHEAATEVELIQKVVASLEYTNFVKWMHFICNVDVASQVRVLDSLSLRLSELLLKSSEQGMNVQLDECGIY